MLPSLAKNSAVGMAAAGNGLQRPPLAAVGIAPVAETPWVLPCYTRNGGSRMTLLPSVCGGGRAANLKLMKRFSTPRHTVQTDREPVMPNELGVPWRGNTGWGPALSSSLAQNAPHRF